MMIVDQVVERQETASVTPTVSAQEVAISVRNVSKMYRIYDRPQDRLKRMLLRGRGGYGREFWALHDVSLDVRKGETVGIIGRNGSGKSTLLQIIAGTLTPTHGEVAVNGRVAALLELGSGFNPEFSGRENVFLNGAILGISYEEMERRFDDIAAFADIGGFIDQPVKVYSSGMVVRLAFAVASCVEPDILIVDEALAVGDVMFQSRCLEKIKRLTNSGATTLFVTHDTGTFQTLCKYGYLLDHGQVFAHGRPMQVALQYYELMRESEHARQRQIAGDGAQSERVFAELRAKEEAIRDKIGHGDGEYRFGAGGAQIVEYRIINSMGAEVRALRVGEKFKVAVRIEFYQRIENLALGVLFRNAQGQNLLGMHSYHEHHVDFGLHDAGEHIEIICEQEMLLNPGDYLLHIAIAECRSDYDFTSLDNRSRLAKISVFGKPISYGLIHTRPRFYLAGDSTTEQATQPEPLKRDLAFLSYSLDYVKASYERALDSPEIAETLQTILRYSDANVDMHKLADGQEEERAWPSEPRFVASGYSRRMLGRYAFAGSQFCRSANVLDTCCGLGWGTFLVAQYARRVTGFDINARVVNFCAATWPARNIRWLTGDARDLTFLGQQPYDVVLGMETIEHFSASDGNSYVRAVAQKLRPGGLFIGTSAFPEDASDARIVQSTNPYHLHIYTREEMLALMNRYFSAATIIGNWMFIGIK